MLLEETSEGKETLEEELEEKLLILEIEEVLELERLD
jgi:hypothetical protein